VPATADRRQLAGRTILAVFAHPDDESLACGGTIARAAAAGARVVLHCASRGERGSVSDRNLVPDGNVGRARTLELFAAAEMLGVSEVVVGSHPDGCLRWANVTALRAEIMMSVRHCRPDAVITFDEDGLYWHADHIGVHERTTTGVGSLGADAPPLYYVALPRGAMRDLIAASQKKGGTQPDPAFWGISPDAFGIATKPPDFAIDVHEWIARKLAAMRCHRTQMGRNNPIAWIDEEEALQWLGTELFRRAPGASGSGDVLETLQS
jgi:N-acetyl-1-D-myo-inositol-2-amino-2-deoxy-alpha-D-glucopyranoside deacetylase